MTAERASSTVRSLEQRLAKTASQVKLPEGCTIALYKEQTIGDYFSLHLMKDGRILKNMITSVKPSAIKAFLLGMEQAQGFINPWASAA